MSSQSVTDPTLGSQAIFDNYQQYVYIAHTYKHPHVPYIHVIYALANMYNNSLNKQTKKITM